MITKHLLAMKNAIVFDEIEGYRRDMSDDGSQYINAIIELSKTSRIPIFCICQNPNIPTIVPLLELSVPIPFF